MNEHEWLAERFEEHRTHLRAVAYRMLGSVSEVDDAVQEAWLRLSRADADGHRQPWRMADHGRRARVPRHAAVAPIAARGAVHPGRAPEPVATARDGTSPEQEALLADSVGLALLVVLDRLTPAERLAFVLHDMFAVPFEEIAPIVGRSAEAARQLASRARRRVRGGTGARPGSRSASVRSSRPSSRRRGGRLRGAGRGLDPDVVLRSGLGRPPPGKPEVGPRGGRVARGAL